MEIWQAKNKANISRVKSNPASATVKVWGESEYHLDLENEDKERYKEKSTLSNGELLPDANASDYNLSIKLIS